LGENVAPIDNPGRKLPREVSFRFPPSDCPPFWSPSVHASSGDGCKLENVGYFCWDLPSNNGDFSLGENCDMMGISWEMSTTI